MLSATAVILITVNLTAQAKADFSGRWTSEIETTSAPDRGSQSASSQGGGGQRGRGRSGDMGSGWGSNITIAQDANRLSVEYALFARNDMQPPIKFNYSLDGSESKNSVMMGRGIQAQTSKTVWADDKLVITTTHNFDDPANSQPLTIEVQQALWLESPTSLVVETTRSGVLGGQPSTTKTVYRKR